MGPADVKGGRQCGVEEMLKMGVRVLPDSELVDMARSVDAVDGEHDVRMQERRGIMLKRLPH